MDVIPSSNRGSKRARTRRALLENAIALFSRAGIRATTSAAIAEAAGVSVATLFNHFATRTDLAEAWVRGELLAVLEAAIDEAGDRGLRGTLRAVCRELASAETWRVDAERRLEAWRITPRAFADRERAAHSRGLVESIVREQQQGRLRADLEATLLAGLVLDALERGVIEGLERALEERREEDGSEPQRAGLEADLSKRAAALRAPVDLVLDGARKRNERVVLPSGAPSGDPRPEEVR